MKFLVGQLPKSTHKKSTNKYDKHEEKRQIILSIIENDFPIHQNRIKEKTKPNGNLHMSGSTVEKIIRELRKDDLIRERKVGNKNCFYPKTDWENEEKLEQDFFQMVIIMQNYLKTIKSQFEKLNLKGKNSIVRKFEHLEEQLDIIPKSYFAYTSPTEPEEDQVIKEIRALVGRSKNKSIQKMLYDAKEIHVNVKKVRKTITELTDKRKTLPKSSKKYFTILHKINEEHRKRDKLLNHLSQIEYNLENKNIFKQTENQD